MVIPVRFSYTYKKYPFSPKATKRSMQLGILTCGAMCLVYGLFWVAIVNHILMLIGTDMGNAAIILSLISLVGLVVLIRCIKRNGAQKVEQLALADLLALQHTDPASFFQYAIIFHEELARYQNIYQPQSSSQYQTPSQTQTAAHKQAASAPVQQTGNSFDIQIEQQQTVSEDPVAVEVPMQSEQPLEQTVPAAESTIPEKKFCGQCGTKLKPGSHFCHNCGSKL